jgi:hypothetical protein
MYDVALEYEGLGLCPIPCDVQKGSCTVRAKWQNDCQNVEGWRSLFENQSGIGIKLGSSSGGLVVIDVDQKHDHTATLSSRFLTALKFMVPDLFHDFYIEETRSGGLHVFYRIKGDAPAKTVPAKTIEIAKDGKEKEVGLIEVLGEGQMVFTFPTPLYTIKQGTIEEIPSLSQDQHDEIINICKSFNELPDVEVKTGEIVFPKGSNENDMRAGSIWNRQCDVARFASYMAANGWKVVKKVGETYFLRRPMLPSDKPEDFSDDKISATWNHKGRKLFVCFSDNAGFESKYKNEKGETVLKGHTPFAVYTQLSHDGDFKAATKKLIEKGYVNPEAWDDVEPLETVKAKPFDLDALLPSGCDEFKRMVSEVATSYQVQPEMVVMPCLSIISLCLAGSAKVQISEDWKEDAPIWSIVVAEASERKSPVLKEVMSPIEEYFKDFGRRYKSELSSAVRRRRALTAKLAKLEGMYDTAVGKGEDPASLDGDISLCEAEIESLPDVVSLPNLLQSDITAEALVQQLKRNGEVCGVISAEADPIEVALGLYSDKPNFSVYLKGFSVERYTANRVGGGETVIEQPRIVLSVMMQREPMQKLSDSRVARKRGFLARCFFAVPTSLVGDRVLEPDPVSESSRAWWSGKIRSILSMPHRLRFTEQDGNAYFCEDGPEVVSLSGEARDVLNVARIANEEGLATGGEFDDESGWGGKLMGNICRLALTLHFLGGRSMHDELSGETMRSACAWIEPLTEHFYCACGAVGEISMDKMVHSTILKMQKKDVKSGAKVNDVFSEVRNKQHNKAIDWQPVWDRMIELGFIRIMDGEKPKGGATPKIMKLHPNFYNLAK